MKENLINIKNIRRKVLIVDDEPISRRLLGFIVDRDFDVIYAENGASNQVVKIQISKVKKSTVDKLRSVTVNVLNFLK